MLKEKCKVRSGNMSPPPRKCCIVAPASKVMTTVFWNAKGTVLTDYVEHGSNVTGTYYADLIGRASLSGAETEETKKVLLQAALSAEQCSCSHISRALAAI